MTHRTLALAAALLLLTSPLAPAQFAPGQVVVLRIGGDGAYNPGGSPLSSSTAAGFIDQFAATTPSQSAPTVTVSLPTTTGGGVNRITFGGTTGTNLHSGQMTRSADGLSLAVPGYDLAPGGSISSSSGNRVVAQVGTNGVVTTPVNTFSYNSVTFNGAVTDTGANFWTAGGGTFGTRVYQPNANPQNGTSVQTTVPVTRMVNIFNGQLYASTASGTRGIHRIGTGLPTSSATTSVFINTGVSSLPAGFAVSPDGQSAYVADERSGPNGGVQRWDRINSTWTLSYTLSVSDSDAFGAYGLAVDFSGTDPVLFATTTEAGQNRLVTIVDTSPMASFVTLAVSPENTVFRGVALSPAPVPEPTTSLAIAAGLGLGGVLVRRLRRAAPAAV